MQRQQHSNMGQVIELEGSVLEVILSDWEAVRKNFVEVSPLLDSIITKQEGIANEVAALREIGRKAREAQFLKDWDEALALGAEPRCRCGYPMSECRSRLWS